MSIPALYIDHSTSTAVRVYDAFAAALADDLLANIEGVACSYDILSDSVLFVVKRKRDGHMVTLPIRRELLPTVAPGHTVPIAQALKHDDQAFARLVLFLA